MNTNSSSPATRRSCSRLFWTARGVLAVAIGSFMLLVHQEESPDQSVASPPSAAAAGLNRIDHRQAVRDKLPATSDDAGPWSPPRIRRWPSVPDLRFS